MAANGGDGGLGGCGSVVGESGDPPILIRVMTKKLSGFLHSFISETFSPSFQLIQFQ